MSDIEQRGFMAQIRKYLREFRRRAEPSHGKKNVFVGRSLAAARLSEQGTQSLRATPSAAEERQT